MKYDFTGKRVFVSGPMSGIDEWNKPAFDAAMFKLWELGAHDVFNPAADAPIGDDTHTHEHWMLRTLNELTAYMTGWDSEHGEHDNRPRYDAILMLDGWRDSIGASVEYAVAKACGIEVLEAREVLG